MPGKKFPLSVASARKNVTKMLFVSFILWIISKKPVTGYDIISMLKNEHENMCVGSAHIYPVLFSMQKNGLISVKVSKSGKRIKKIYSITSSGKNRLSQIKQCIFCNNLRGRFFKEMVS